MKKMFVLLLFVILSFPEVYSNDLLWQRVPTENHNHMNNVAFNYTYDGKYVVTAFEDWIAVYDAVNKEPLNILYTWELPGSGDNRVWNVFSKKDSNIIFSQSLDYLSILEIPSLRLLEFKDNFYGDIFCVTSDWKYSASASYLPSNKIYVKDFKDNSMHFIDSIFDEDKSDIILSMKFSKSGQYLLVEAGSGNLILYDVEKKERITNIEPESFFYSSEFSPDSHHLIISSHEIDFIYNFISHDTIHIFSKSFEFPGSKVKYSKSGKYISIINEQDSITIYDTEKYDTVASWHFPELINIIPDYEDSYHGIYHQEFSKNDSTLFLCMKHHNYELDIYTGEIVGAYSSHKKDIPKQSGHIFFANNDEYLVTISFDRMMIWEARTGKFIKTIELSYEIDSRYRFDLTPNADEIIFSNWKNIYFFNLKDEIITREITPNSRVNVLSISGNGKYLGYIQYNDSLKIMDLETNEIIYYDDVSYKDYETFGIEMSYDSICAVLQTYKIHENKRLNSRTFNYIKGNEISYPEDGSKVKFIDNNKFIAIDFSNISMSYLDYSKNRWLTDTTLSLDMTSDFEVTKDGNFLLTSGPVIWNLETLDSVQLHAEPELSYDYLEHWMYYVAVSSDNKLAAAISPEGRICVWDIEKYVTDVEEYISEKNGIQIYPNPATDYIEIKTKNVETGLRPVSKAIEIFDVIGRRHTPSFGHPSREGIYRLDVSYLQPGIYFVRVGYEILKFVKI